MRVLGLVVLLAAWPILAFGASYNGVGEKNVVDLTTAAFKSALVERTHMLVEFYKVDSELSKGFRPFYASIATHIKKLNPSVLVARVDAMKEEEVANQYGIHEVPILLWFRDGTAYAQFPFDGPVSEDSVLRWAKKLLESPVKEVDSLEALQAIQTSPVVLLGYFEEFSGEEHTALQQLALEDYDVEFAKTTDAVVAAELGIKSVPGFAVARNVTGHEFATAQFQGHPKSKGKEPLAERLQSFLLSELLPDFLVYDAETMVEVGARVTSVPIGYHVYVSAPAEQLQAGGALLAAVRDAARQMRGEVIFMVHKLAPGTELPLYDFFKVDSHAARVQVVGAQTITAMKFNFTEPEATAEALVEFARAIKAGSAPHRIFSSGPVPASPNDVDNVTVVVGSTFDAIAKDPTKDVLVEVYAPWCQHSQDFAPTYSRLATVMSGVESVVIAKVDKDENEHTDLDQVTSLPSLLFYPAEHNSKAEPIDLAGKNDVESLVNFLTANARVKFTTPDLTRFPEPAVDEGDDYALEEDFPRAPSREEL